MSEIYENQPVQCYYASGVFKVDYKSAWFKDLFAIAQGWSKDEKFHYLEVRKVSPENRGIQFVYYDADAKGSSEKGGVIRHIYKKQLLEKFEKWFYAWDYMECDENPQERVIVFKPLA